MKEDSDPVSQNPDLISSETQSRARGITRYTVNHQYRASFIYP